MKSHLVICLGLWCCLLVASLPLAFALDQENPKPKLPGREPPAIPVEQFRTLHTLIKPGADELRFQQIPWLIDVWEARKKAAALGKPILVWSGAGGAPLGVC